MTTAITDTRVAPRPRWLFVKEAAEELRMSEASVWWLINQKKIRSGKVSGRRVITPDALDEYVRSCFEEEA